MNNNPIKQHYVPKTYLRNFSFDEKGNLFALKVKSPEKTYITYESSPMERNVSGICYEKNFYTIKTDELSNEPGVESKYDIEKKSFEYENRMNQIFDNLISNDTISIEAAYEIAFMLMDIKIRNPRMRNKLVPISKELFVKELNSAKLEKEIKELGRLPGENPKRLYKGIKNELLRRNKDENYSIDLCNRLLLNKSKMHIEYAKYLATRPFYLYKAPESKFFITNDNPGFSVLPGGRIEDTHFNDFLAFIFPLKPQWLLHIDNRPHIKSENGTIKKIIIEELKSDFVDYTNLITLKNCNEYIFSNNKETLCEIKNLHTNSKEKFNKPKPPK